MVKRWVTLIGILILVFTAAPLFADDTENIDAAYYDFSQKRELRSFCDRVIEYIKDDTFEKAFALLKAYWPFAASEIVTVQLQTVQQFPVLKERFGSPIGYRMVREEEVAYLFLRYTYTILYEKHIIRWVFIFYKPMEQWFLNSFYWDDNVEAVF